MAQGVSIGGVFDSVLERDLADALAQLLSGASWLRNWRIEKTGPGKPEWDFVVSGPAPSVGKAVLCVECKGINFQPSLFSGLANRPCFGAKAGVSAKVLAMPRVSPRMAALCQEHGWSWYDLAGNCRLEIPGVLLIERSGKEPVKVPAAQWRQPEYARGRPRGSGPAGSRERRAALDAAGDGRPFRGPHAGEFRRRALPS